MSIFTSFFAALDECICLLALLSMYVTMYNAMYICTVHHVCVYAYVHVRMYVLISCSVPVPL